MTIELTLNKKDRLKNLSFLMVGIAGFEPANDGVKVRCLTTWLYPSNIFIIPLKH